MNNQARLNQIQNLLSSLQNIRLFRIPSLSDQVFELYCYFRKLEEFVNGGKIPACQSRYPGIFRPHLKPGRPRSGDYFRLIDPQGGENRDLILNGEFKGISGILHSPDISLTQPDEDEIISIYECKNYSNSLGPGVYREFIGYCEEMGLLVRSNKGRFSAVINTFAVMTPCIYTSAIVNRDHAEKLKKTYNFSVVDQL
jgi:hypothetical protein